MPEEFSEFRVLRPGGQTWETDLLAVVRYYMERFFPDAGDPSLLTAEYVEELDGPARLLPTQSKIQVKECFAPFVKFCCIAVLHELIHYSLLKRNNDPDEAEGERFQAEIDRLWNAGAYRGLL